MGLIGWADAPNSIEEDQTLPEPRITPQVVPIESEQAEAPDTIEGIDDSIEEAPEGAKSNEELDENPVNIESRSEFDVDDCASENPACNELLYAIRNLKLTGNADENRYDISRFELHEVKFLFEHAERCGCVDYFSAVREVFGVKHRILDEKNDIDSIESPNLDELMAFVEEKYENSFGGETS